MRWVKTNRERERGVGLTGMRESGWTASQGLSVSHGNQTIIEPRVLDGVERGHPEVGPCRYQPGITPQEGDEPRGRGPPHPEGASGIWRGAGEVHRAIGRNSVTGRVQQDVLRTT